MPVSSLIDTATQKRRKALKSGRGRAHGGLTGWICMTKIYNSYEEVLKYRGRA